MHPCHPDRVPQEVRKCYIIKYGRIMYYSYFLSFRKSVEIKRIFTTKFQCI